MDFGIDRLIEMLEERFGRFPSTVLLALVCVAAVGLALKTIYGTILLPVASVIAAVWAAISAMKPVSIPHPVEFWAAVFLAALVSWGAIFGVHRFLESRKRIEASFQAIRNRLANLEYDKRTVEQERDALQHFLNRAGGSPELQSPEGTEEDKRP